MTFEERRQLKRLINARTRQELREQYGVYWRARIEKIARDIERDAARLAESGR